MDVCGNYIHKRIGGGIKIERVNCLPNIESI